VERGVYPEQVWAYLSDPPLDGSGKPSRKEALAETWQQRGMMARTDQAIRLRKGTKHLRLARIAPQLLEDRLAMLSELRSVAWLNCIKLWCIFETYRAQFKKALLTDPQAAAEHTSKRQMFCSFAQSNGYDRLRAIIPLCCHVQPEPLA